MASANLRFRVNGGAVQSGSATVSAGDTIALTATNFSGWTAPAARWEILAYPDGFTCPTGWTTDATTGAYYYLASAVTGITPPDFDLPDSAAVTAGQWGKFLFRLIVNGTVVSQICAVEIVSPNGVHDLAVGESSEFGGATRLWVGDQQTNLRTFDGALAGGAPVGADYLIGTANGSLASAVVWTSISTTVAFASTSTIPCSFARTQATTNTAVTAMTVKGKSSTTPTTGFGVACDFQAGNSTNSYVDAGRIAFTWTTATASSETSKFVVQLRSGGASLADMFTLSPTAWRVKAVSGSGSGFLAVDNNGDITVSAGGGGAPTDAPYLTVGAVSGLSDEVDVTGVSSTIAFASSSTIPFSTTRTDSATNTVVDVEKTVALTSSTAAASFGVGHLYQAEQAAGSQVDIGRTAFRWTSATTLSEASEWIVQLRFGGDGLTTKLSLSGAGRLTVTDLTLSGLTTGYLYVTSGVVSVGTAPAPANGTYLVNGAVSGLASAVDVTDIGTTQSFSSTSTEPVAFRRQAAGTNDVVQVASFRRTSGGTPANNIGGQIGFELPDAAGNVETASYLTWRLTNAADGAEASELGLWTRTGGGALTKHAYLTGAGAWTATSIDSVSVTASGGTITVGAGTTSNFGTSSTTNNFGVGGATNTITGDMTRVATNPSSTNTAVDMFALRRETSGTAASGIGMSIPFEIENTAGTLKTAGYLKATLNTATNGNETTRFAFWNMGAGGAASEKFYWQYDGNFFGDYVTFSNIFASVTTSGFRFNDANNRGGLDQDGSNHLRLKSYNTKDIVFYTGADASGVGGVLRLTISSAGLATFTGAVAGPRRYSAPTTPASSANAVTFNLTTGQNVEHAITEDTTVTITGGSNGQHGIIVFTQPASAHTVTMPTNGVGVEYDATILGLGLTSIVSTTNLSRTLLAYYILANGRAYIYSRSTEVIP